jgi:hypothetical protein
MKISKMYRCRQTFPSNILIVGIFVLRFIRNRKSNFYTNFYQYIDALNTRRLGIYKNKCSVIIFIPTYVTKLNLFLALLIEL